MSHNLADARSKCITVFRQRDLGNFRVTSGMGLYIHIEHYIFLKKQKSNKKLGINVTTVNFFLQFEGNNDLNKKLHNLENFSEIQIFTMWRGYMVPEQKNIPYGRYPFGDEETKQYLNKVKEEKNIFLHTFTALFHQTSSMQLRSPP